MIICKGHEAVFEMADGKVFKAPLRAGMLHDPDGESWPKRSVLFTSYRRGRKPPADYKGPAKAYLGRTYDPKLGQVELPTKTLHAWSYVGRVKTIYYRRPGSRAPGLYRHTFGKGDPFHRLAKGNGPMPRLFRLGRSYRLEMPPGSALDDRGYVWP